MVKLFYHFMTRDVTLGIAPLRELRIGVYTDAEFKVLSITVLTTGRGPRVANGNYMPKGGKR